MIYFPDNTKPYAINITTYAPALFSQDFAGTRATRSFDVHRWLLHVAYPVAMYREYWGRAFGFYAGQMGRYRTFDIIPDGINRQGIGTGTPLVDGGSQTGRQVNTKDWGISETGIVKKGDYIRIDKKVYLITADENSDGSGDATIDIEPALVSSPADNTPVIVTNVPFRVALLNDEIESTFDYNGIYTLEVELAEVID